MDKKNYLFVESYIQYNILNEWLGIYMPYVLANMKDIKTPEDFYDVQKELYTERNYDSSIKPPLQMDFEKEVRKTRIPVIFFDEKDIRNLKWFCPLSFVRKWMKERDVKFKDYIFFKLFFKYVRK